MAAAISLDCHKFQQAKRKSFYSRQAYFSFTSPAPLTVHAEKYGWFARLLQNLVVMLKLERERMIYDLFSASDGNTGP